MAILSVRRYGDPILRQKATPVASLTPAITTILEDLVETMFQQVGIGLAAPQVGIPLRLIVMDDGKRGARALVNPVIIERRGAVRAEEGCLSLPGIFAEVERSESVRVEALDGDGAPVSFEARDLHARVIQHEVDHLDGILFLDRVASLKTDLFRRKKYR